MLTIEHPATQACLTYGTAAADVQHRMPGRDAQPARDDEARMHDCGAKLASDLYAIVEFYDSVAAYDARIIKIADDFLANRISGVMYEAHRADALYRFRQAIAVELERFNKAKRETGYAA